MELDRARQIFDDIKDLRIELLRDPASLGPDYLQENISLCRNYLNKVSYYLQEVMEETHLMSLHLDGLEASFKLESDELLANDPRVMHLPSVEDRAAMISVILGKQVREIQKFKREIVNLKHIDKVVRHRKQELDNTMSTLRLQTSLLRDQLRSGLSYGDTTDVREAAREDARKRALQGDPVNLDDLVDESAAELDSEGSLVGNLDEVGSSKSVPAESSEEEPLSAVDEDGLPTFDEDDVDDLISAAPKSKKSKKSVEKTAAPAGDFDDLDDLISGGGVDGVLIPASKKQEPSPKNGEKAPLEKSTLSLDSEDIDADMQRFLEEESGDGLDALLADI